MIADYPVEEVEMMNNTARSKGAVGANAVIHRLVAQNSNKDDKILDYGAGKDLIHVNMLTNTGFRDVRGFDIGKNQTPKHLDIYADFDRHTNQYDVVYASNVLNVQPSWLRVAMIVETSYKILKMGGLFYCNYPKSPRKHTLEPAFSNEGSLDELLRKHYRRVVRIKDTVWVAVK